MLIEKDHCDYETCVALKELGFHSLVDWYFKEDKSIASSLARYRNTYIPRISLYEAQKWLREEKKVEVNAFWDRIAEKWYSYINFMYYPDLMGIEVIPSIYDSYEEALSEGIKEAVKILKENESI